VQCALTGVTKDQIGGSLGGIGWGGAGGFGGGAVAPRASNLSITCRIYDSSTSEVIASVQKDKSKVDVGAAAFGGPGGFALGGDFFYKDPVGKTLAALIKDTLIDLTDRVQRNPWAAN
jgi:curli biogenesis system outer membrane secretion channel CsgG